MNISKNYQISQILSDIDKNISNKYSEYVESRFDKISLNSGTSGLALFYGYLYKQSKKKEHLERCHEILNEGITELNKSTQPSLFSGFTGFLWIIRHLINEKILSKNSFDNLNEIDQMVEKSSEYYFRGQ